MNEIKSEQLDDYAGLGKALRLSNGQYDLVLTLNIGPRILHFALTGGENALAQDVAERLDLPDGSEWRLVGGHRVWHSPEAFPRTYQSDSHPLESWHLTEDGAELWQREEQWTHMVKGLHVRLGESGVEVRSRLRNVGAWPVETAVWAITVVPPGGMALSPLTPASDELLPSASFVTWPYTHLNDTRISWGEKYIRIRQDPTQRGEFKIGYANQAGWAAYLRDGLGFIKHFNHLKGEKYPDMGCNYECYSTEWGLELETLSPLSLLEPGETLEHCETWRLFRFEGPLPEDDTKVSALLDPVIGFPPATIDCV